MGIGYTSRFGVGYKIKKIPLDVIADAKCEDYEEYLDSILNKFSKGVSYFETGHKMYGGGVNYFLVVDNPFELGLDIAHIKDCLDDIIDSSELERDSEFMIVGGLEVW